MPQNRRPAVVDLISDDEDDDLDAPVTAKPVRPAPKALQTKNALKETILTDSETSKGVDSAESKVPQHTPMQKACPSTSGILGLNRKQMEGERLARLAKLDASTGAGRDQPKATEESKKRKAAALSPETRDERNVKAKAAPSLQVFKAVASSIVNHHPSNVSSNGQSISSGSFGSGMQYPNGTVKKTWAYGFPRDGNDIKIEEVLQKDDLELAVLSAFQIDSDWIMSKLNEKTKVVWVLQAKSEAEVRTYTSERL